MGAHEQTGVAGLLLASTNTSATSSRSTSGRGRDKEDDRTRHILELRAQTGPVFLTYRASAGDRRARAARSTAAAPLFDFTAADGVQHTLWRVDGGDAAALVAAFAAVPALYIADGHHRAASAARARQQLARRPAARGEWDTFLAVAFPDDQMQVLPYNRVVKDLRGHDAGGVPGGAAGALRGRPTGRPSPARQGDVAMFLDGRWHTIALGAAAGRRCAGGSASTSAACRTRCSTPLLGIGDVRTDKRIDFVGGARGTGELERLVTSGKAAVAFSLYPGRASTT